MPELGEARARDEADPAGAEDADLAHRGAKPTCTVVRGLRPLAIASIVSFESESSSVFTTQYVAPCCAQDDHVQVRARVVEVELAAAEDRGGSCGRASAGASVPVGLLDAPELVAAGVEDEPHGLVLAASVDPVAGGPACRPAACPGTSCARAPSAPSAGTAPSSRTAAAAACAARRRSGRSAAGASATRAAAAARSCRGTSVPSTTMSIEPGSSASSSGRARQLRDVGGLHQVLQRDGGGLRALLRRVVVDLRVEDVLRGAFGSRLFGGDQRLVAALREQVRRVRRRARRRRSRSARSR